MSKGNVILCLARQQTRAGAVEKLQAMGLKPARMSALEIGEYADMYIAQHHKEFIAKATRQSQFLVEHGLFESRRSKGTPA